MNKDTKETATPKKGRRGRTKEDGKTLNMSLVYNRVAPIVQQLSSEITKEEAGARRKELEKHLSQKNVWGYTEVGLEAKRAAYAMLTTKNGMYAKIPIICKEEDCPYGESCRLLQYDIAPKGQPCPIETTLIEMKYAGYAQDFDIDKASYVDKCLINEIISLDIMIERCKTLIAKYDGVPVTDIVVNITESGDEIRQPQISKYLEAYEKLTKRRSEVYQLMMATRKDKKGQKDVEETSIINVMAEVLSGNENDDNKG